MVHPGNREDRPITEIWKAITPAAVISFTEFSAADMAAMRSAGVALVVALLGRASHDQRELEVPQHLIGRRQAEHLTAAGHTRLGYASPTTSGSGSSPTRGWPVCRRPARPRASPAR